MYMGLRSLLEVEFKKGTELDGNRIGFGSYGSGSSAMVFSAVIQPDYKEVVKRMDIEEDIGQRQKLGMEQYERLHRNEQTFNDSVIHAHKEFVLVKLGGTTADKAGFREYDYVS
jgi:hydroxymethylglutaryl-CoA synthase